MKHSTIIYVFTEAAGLMMVAGILDNTMCKVLALCRYAFHIWNFETNIFQFHVPTTLTILNYVVLKAFHPF